jgi:hypothetical protein
MGAESEVREISWLGAAAEVADVVADSAAAAYPAAGIRSWSPGKMIDETDNPFVERTSFKLTPYAAAIIPSVSPEATVWIFSAGSAAAAPVNACPVMVVS